MKKDTVKRVERSRLEARLEIERFKTVRCVMRTSIGLISVVAVSLIALAAYFDSQGNPVAAQRYATAFGIAVPSLSTALVAVSAIIKRDR